MKSKYSINLGNLLENTKVKGSIINPLDKTVSYVDPSCGCMTVKYLKDDNLITVKYNAGIIDSRTIKEQGFQEIHKYVTIYYTDGSTLKINILGKIYPRN